MLDSMFAQNLVERIMRNLGYNINIMNGKGIIIASGDHKRVGDFHEVAYEVIRKGLEYKLVKPDKNNYIGVKPGINMPITYEGETIGAVGITGDPEEVFKFAYLARISVEMMIQQEYYKKHLRLKQSKHDFLCSALLFEPLNINKLEHLVKSLRYDLTLPRVPMKLCVSFAKDNETVLEKIKGEHLLTAQDIAMPLGDNCIAIFKEFPGNKAGKSREVILQYINSVRAVLPEPENIMFLVGTAQRRLREYRQVFGYLTWLEDNIKPEIGGDYFFVDYVDRYLQSIIPFQTFESIFSSYVEPVEKYGSDIFIETMAALYHSSMNINETAKRLFVHRNTVLLRIRKMKEVLGIDPIHNIKDRNFAFHLAYYVKNLLNAAAFNNNQEMLNEKYS